MSKIVRINISSTNCYFWAEPSGTLMIDACNAGDEGRVLDGMSNAGLRPENIKLLLLTHGHPDHIGTAEFMREKYGVPIARFSAVDHQLEEMSPRGLKGRALLRFIKMSGRSPRASLEPDILLEDGQSLAEYGFDAQVIHLPGHSSDSIGLVTASRDFFCGDTLFNLGSPTPAPIATDFDKLRDSVGKLSELDGCTAYPGHGAPFTLDFKKLARSL